MAPEISKIVTPGMAAAPLPMAPAKKVNLK